MATPADSNPTHARPTATTDRGAAQLAHELNNLLDGSLRSVELAIRRLRDTALDDTQRDALGKLETADRLMLRMIEVIEAWAKLPTSDRANANDKSSIDTLSDSLRDHTGTIADAIQYAMHAFGPSLDDMGITLACIVDQDAAKLPADAIYSVLANAIRNAQQSIESRRSSMPDAAHNDRVEVRLDLDDGEVVLTVTDSGAGLDRSLFDASGRLKIGLTTKADGHGVGLGVCKQIAVKLGGRITLSNQKPRGAVFTLRFPARPSSSNGSA